MNGLKYSIIVIVGLLLIGCATQTLATPTATSPPSSPPPTTTATREHPTPTSIQTARIELVTIITGGDIPLSQPNDVELDRDGNLFVLDGKNNLIQVFNPAGEAILSWGGTGKEEGQFNFYSITHDASFGCLAIGPSGNVFVSDYYNHRIQVFLPTGEFLRAWKILFPVCLDVDSQENVYVIDTFKFLLHKFDAMGNLLLETGGKDSGEGDLETPYLMYVDNRDVIWVADYDRKTAMTFDPTGKFLGAYGEPGKLSGPTGIAVDGEGNFYITEWQQNRLQKFDPTGKWIWTFAEETSEDISLSGSAGVEVDRDGNIYIADYGNNRILMLRQNW
jgi:DNA-binding beta-propeller fold protein YncE